MNYLKTLDFGKEGYDNKDNCELLHDAVVSGKKDSLLRNDDYDYFIMENPERVSIHYNLNGGYRAGKKRRQRQFEGKTEVIR